MEYFTVFVAASATIAAEASCFAFAFTARSSLYAESQFVVAGAVAVAATGTDTAHSVIGSSV